MMKINIPKTAKADTVFIAEVDETEISPDEVNWSNSTLKKAVKSECEKAGISADIITVGSDNNGNSTFAIVTVF
ncbi:MAG: hypothetical protein VW879_01885 [Opitutae bacterium]